MKMEMILATEYIRIMRVYAGLKGGKKQNNQTSRMQNKMVRWYATFF